MAAIKMWAKHSRNQLIHIYCDNETAVTIFQAGRPSLAVGHIAGELLISSADSLSH